MAEAEQKQAEIIKYLGQYQKAGLKFGVAHDKLIAQGYSEEEISQAVDSSHYDVDLQPDIPNQVTQYFRQHPDQAVQDGDKLLKAKHKEEVQDERLQATLDSAASDAAPDIQSEVDYDYRFARDVGMPYWVLCLLGLAVDGIAYGATVYFDLSNLWFYVITSVLGIGLTVFLILRIR